MRSLPNVSDSDPEEPLAHSIDDIKEIKDIMYKEVTSARKAAGQKLMTVDESMEFANRKAMSVSRRVMEVDGKGKLTGNGSFVTDGFWNPMTGIGSMDDPGMYQYSYIPVSMSPQEATSYYASGGIPAVITDKKCKGAMLNGYTFEGDGWTPDEVKQLHDYCEQIGYGVAIADSLRDGLIFGGAICYPRLKQDNVTSLEQGMDDLLKSGVITKDCVDHFVTTDRWNCVLVPNWNVTARDYLTPSHYYIPIGGVKVASARSAIVRPKMLPYWGMLPQIGWGVSDFEGYITSYLAYKLTIMSIPIMAQQMSILFHEIPLEGVIAQNGISSIEDLLANNDQVMRSWSILHPASIPSFGVVKAVERHYEGFNELVLLLQVDVCAQAEMPQSVVFPSQPKGLADSNEEDVLLKQAESVRKISDAVAPQYRRVNKILALSCFGPDYFSGPDGERKLGTLMLSFNPPSVQSSAEKAESGGKFADFVQKLVASELPVDAVLELSKQFFPDIEIPKEIMARIAAIPESYTPPDYEKVLSVGGLVQQLVSKTEAPTTNLERVLNAGDLAKQLVVSVGNGNN